MQPKVTYRLGVYSRIYKVQEGKLWNTSFITLTRDEVQEFHASRKMGDKLLPGKTIESLLQEEFSETSPV